MSKENIENITKSDSNFAPTFVDHHIFPDIDFNKHHTINYNISLPKKIMNLYIYYILNPWLRNLDKDFTLKNCLFGSVKLTKTAEPDKCKHSGCGKGFDYLAESHLQMEAWETMLLFLNPYELI